MNSTKNGLDTRSMIFAAIALAAVLLAVPMIGSEWSSADGEEYDVVFDPNGGEVTTSGDSASYYPSSPRTPVRFTSPAAVSP